MALSQEQFEAVNAGQGYIQVEASAGSGKTRVLVERFKRLVASGIPKNDILSVTFTKSAADEMYSRAFERAMKNGRGGFRTFHGFALRLLLNERQSLSFRLDADPVLSRSETKGIVSKILRDFPLLNYKEAKRYIGIRKRSGISPTQAIASEVDYIGAQLAQVYAAYERACRDLGKIDFDSMTVEAVRLLENDPMVRDRFQFAFVQSDESQDNSNIEWRLLRLVSEEHGNLFAVGDTNQSIYGFRGAASERFLNFEKAFPGARTLYLSRNYRSTPRLVEFSKSIMPTDTGLRERLHSLNPDGPEPSFRCFGSNTDEAIETAWRATSLTGTTAILARTNKQLAVVEDALLNLRFEYKTVGRTGFWSRPEIQDLVAFCRIVEEPLNNDAVVRVISSPYPCAKYLGKKFTEKLSRPYLSGLMDYRNGWQGKIANRLGVFLRELRAEVLQIKKTDLALNHIIDRVGMFDYYAAEEEPDEMADNRQIENLLEAVRVAGGFDSLGEFIAHADRAIQSAHNEDSSLTLATIHASKGKEFDNVFLIGVCEGILPHRSGEVEEESRLLYVGATRAGVRLELSFYGTPSRFIERFLREEKVA